jgi:hypothetical protein
MTEARGAEGTARFLLVLTDSSVVTLFTIGRARINLKHGLEAPNPDDLVSRNRHSYSSPFSCSSLRRSIMTLEKKKFSSYSELTKPIRKKRSSLMIVVQSNFWRISLR